MVQDIRWIQRLDSYNSALGQLLDAAGISKLRPYTDLEKQGIIQAFEFTHELAWNMIKDYFEYQGNSSITGSRDASREAFKMGLIVNADLWMEMIKSRNLTSHTYNKKVADDVVHKTMSLYLNEFLALVKKMEALRP